MITLNQNNRLTTYDLPAYVGKPVNVKFRSPIEGFDRERLAFWREEVTLPGAELIHFDSGTMEVILRLSDGKILQVHPMMITSAS